EGARALRTSLVPQVDVLTPTMLEAAQLLGTGAATTIDEMREQALALRALGPQTVLVTGGRLVAEDVVDVLVHPGGTDLLRAERIPERRVRGAGTTLSAAIAAQLARIAEFDRAGELAEIGEEGTDDDMVTIVASAREFLASAVENADDWQVSQRPGGHGPLNHLITLVGDSAEWGGGPASGQSRPIRSLSASMRPTDSRSRCSCSGAPSAQSSLAPTSRPVSDGSAVSTSSPPASRARVARSATGTSATATATPMSSVITRPSKPSCPRSSSSTTTEENIAGTPSSSCG